ncbi:MAG TPA: nucleotide disphospho-sugar-binding domain-containing protein [Candidatus Polarisedimenticolaceae bacterium]|nr:nucleotide disphospho-sugar-binding domain-containing protein [Candidatus Polarisedimenticolaceae bacterium]
MAGGSARAAKKRILFGMFPAWGHVAPTVAIAQQLQDRGHDVAYAVHPAISALLAEAGLETLAGLGWGRVAVRSQQHLQRGGFDLAWLVRVARGRPATTLVDDLPRGVDELRVAMHRFWPDVIVNDLLFAPGSIAAELAGVPWAGSCPFALPQWDDDLPPYGSGIPYGAPRDLRWRLLDLRTRRFRRRLDRSINRARRKLGAEALPHPFSRLSPWLDVAYVTEAIEYPRPSLGRQVHFVGPSISRRRGDHRIPFPWDWLDGCPLVLVSLGTIFVHHERFLRSCAEAARDQPWQMVVRVGPAFDPTRGEAPPDNVRFVTELAQLALLPKCAAMLSHAGMSSVLEALSEGVPLVLAPAAVEQPDTAARVVRAGAGIRIDLRRAGRDEIRTALRRVLDEPAFRENARRIAGDFARCDGPVVAADLIERLADTRRPVLRPPGRGPTVYVR